VTDRLPNQVCTWLFSRSGWTPDPDESGASEPAEWLYCLKSTEPGDRQFVWSGVDGDGIVAVVDFQGAVRLRRGETRLYEGWGRITSLPRPISVTTAQSDRALKRLFGKSIQGVWSVPADVAQAVSDRAGGLPPVASFEAFPPNWREAGGDWSGSRLPPEIIVEDIVLDKGHVARRLGFPSRVNPYGRKQKLLNGRYPDLWCPDGVVGDVKNMVTANWGPDQIEDYIEQCDAEWPNYRWRGLLIQGEPDMPPNAYARLQSSRYRRRIEVWAVEQGRLGRVSVTQLFP
jgi:hypothetical protein